MLKEQADAALCDLKKIVDESTAILEEVDPISPEALAADRAVAKAATKVQKLTKALNEYKRSGILRNPDLEEWPGLFCMVSLLRVACQASINYHEQNHGLLDTVYKCQCHPIMVQIALLTFDWSVSSQQIPHMDVSLYCAIHYFSTHVWIYECSDLLSIIEAAYSTCHSLSYA